MHALFSSTRQSAQWLGFVPINVFLQAPHVLRCLDTWGRPNEVGYSSSSSKLTCCRAYISLPEMRVGGYSGRPVTLLSHFCTSLRVTVCFSTLSASFEHAQTHDLTCWATHTVTVPLVDAVACALSAPSDSPFCVLQARHCLPALSFGYNRPRSSVACIRSFASGVTR